MKNLTKLIRETVWKKDELEQITSVIAVIRRSTYDFNKDTKEVLNSIDFLSDNCIIGSQHAKETAVQLEILYVVHPDSAIRKAAFDVYVKLVGSEYAYEFLRIQKFYYWFLGETEQRANEGFDALNLPRSERKKDYTRVQYMRY